MPHMQDRFDVRRRRESTLLARPRAPAVEGEGTIRAATRGGTFQLRHWACVSPVPSPHAQLDGATDQRGHLLVGMARVDAHSFADDAKRPFHDPTVASSRVGQLECSLVDALELAGSQLVAALKDVTELAVAVSHLATQRGARNG